MQEHPGNTENVTNTKVTPGPGPNQGDVREMQIQETFEADKKEKRRIYKNILLISTGFLCNFIAYGGLSRLQSSLHRVEGMGVINQSVLYTAMVLSCLFVPRFMIKFLGHKWAICVSMMGYMTWMGANGYAIWATMVPTSIIVGICAAPLWTSQCSYFTKLGIRYSKISREKEDAVITHFFGIFFMFFQMYNIISSIIMTTILYSKPENGTPEVTEEELNLCGANDYPGKNDTNINLKKPDAVTLWTLVGVYIAIAALAVIIIGVFMDPLPKELLDDEAEGMSLGQQSLRYMVATLRQLRHKEQLIIIPLTIYSGLEQALFGAEWTKSFVSCPLGIWQVGLVTLPFGIVNTAASFTSGRLVKYTGRIPLFTAAFILDLCIQITMMLWLPRPESAYALYILSALWGFTDAIWQTQINGMYGCIFSSESEAAFSNYRMWESTGFIIGFAWSNFLPTSIKIYIVTGVLCLGMTLYYILETILWQNARKADISTLDYKDAGSKKDPPLDKGRFATLDSQCI